MSQFSLEAAGLFSVLRIDNSLYKDLSSNKYAYNRLPELWKDSSSRKICAERVCL